MPNRKPYFSSPFKLGILGGGQLGKMLLSETRRYDIQTKVIDPSPQAPGKFATNEFIVGDFTDEKTVLDFGKDCDVLTIEIENVNTEALRKLINQGVRVFPKPDTLDLIKDKRLQKEFYKKNNIPTSPFFTFETKTELLEKLDETGKSLPFVWKAATGGYDGKGVEVVKTEEQILGLPDQAGLIEDLIPFEKELAVVVARNENGETASFPLVEMDFHPVANLVEYVFSPSLAPEELKKEARLIAEGLAKSLNHVGILAVEMFLTAEGKILINEIAPRVHNSGHLTIEGNICSQFEQHLRAILNLPLGSTDILKPSVMINLNGEENFEGPVFYEGIHEIMAIPGVYIHLYGKSETRPFRKMGHVTVISDTLDEAREIAKKVKSTIRVISK